jgi:hypothetical protein
MLDMTKSVSFFLDVKKNVLSIAAFVLALLLISPLFPGVSWFRLGDFTLYTVNFYHVIMIPLALILILVTANIFNSSNKLRNFLTLTTFPVLLFSLLGLVLFYPTWAVNADAVMQTIRDIIMVIDGILLVIMLLIFPLTKKNEFKSVYGAYILVLLASISATIAASMGMAFEYGSLYGFTSISFFNSYVNSIGGLSTFLGNALTTHSHEMLPAVMGGIVGLTAVIFGYNKLSTAYRTVVNVGLLISSIGIIAMTYIYLISSLGTYVIPTIFPFGPGGVNGLALDDSQTGIVGIGALIAIIGLVKTFESLKGRRSLQISSIATWVVAMATMVGVGYVIEFNEAFFGFGNPPSTGGGPGYLWDLAFTNGHLMLVFFMLVVAAGLFVTFYYLYKNDSSMFRIASYTAIAGMVLGAEGLVVYVLTLSWVVEAVGIWLIYLSLVLAIVPFFRKAPIQRHATT